MLVFPYTLQTLTEKYFSAKMKKHTLNIEDRQKMWLDIEHIVREFSDAKARKEILIFAKNVYYCYFFLSLGVVA